MKNVQLHQPTLESQYFVQTPSELTARLNSSEADIVMMPQQLWLDLEDQVRNAANGENRTVLESRQANEQVSRSLLNIGIDSPNLVSAMATAIDLFAEIFEREKVEVRLELTDQQSCPKFHCDNVFVRMLATYFGPTTEFIARNEPNAIHRAPLYSLVFLKGHQHPTYQDRILHRSPAFLAGEKRLCMIVNFCDWLSV
jgi:hypothetical protein